MVCSDSGPWGPTESCREAHGHILLPSSPSPFLFSPSGSRKRGGKNGVLMSAAVVGLLLHLGAALDVAWVMVMAAITGGSPGAVGEEYADLVLQYCLFFLLVPYAATLLGDYLQSSSSLPFNLLSCAAVALVALWLILLFDFRFRTTLYTRIPHNTHPISNPSSQPQALLAQHSLFGWSQECVRRLVVVPSLLLALLVPDVGPCRAVLRGCFVVGNSVALWWLYRRRWWRR